MTSEGSWYKCFCKSGELLYYHNPVTDETRWPNTKCQIHCQDYLDTPPCLNLNSLDQNDADNDFDEADLCSPQRFRKRSIGSSLFPGSPEIPVNAEPSSMSTPTSLAAEKKQTSKKLTKPATRSVHGVKYGSELYSAHKSTGTVIGGDLPRFRETGWPPSFKPTVVVMRDFLLTQCGSDDRWNTKSFHTQKSYFNRVLGLTGTKTSSGNIYLYYKVSNLSARSWKLATTIMDKIENGDINVHKRQRQGKYQNHVVQKCFQCLSGLCPIDDEEAIYNILQAYCAKGEIPLRHKAVKASSATEVSSVLEKLEVSYQEKTSAEIDRTALQNEIATLKDEFRTAKERVLSLQKEIDGLAKKTKELSEALEVERKNNEYLSSIVTKKEKDNNLLRKELSLNKAHDKHVEVRKGGKRETLQAGKTVQEDNMEKRNRDLKWAQAKDCEEIAQLV